MILINLNYFESLARSLSEQIASSLISTAENARASSTSKSATVEKLDLYFRSQSKGKTEVGRLFFSVAFHRESVRKVSLSGMSSQLASHSSSSNRGSATERVPRLQKPRCASETSTSSAGKMTVKKQESQESSRMKQLRTAITVIKQVCI